MISVETKDILLELREKNHLTQGEIADRLFVTRQAVSRWETGETTPNPDTLKTISREFNVSVNTLLGAPRTLVCQCCGMPLADDGTVSREPDGSFNESYCKWCYHDGNFEYKALDELLDFLVPHLAQEHQMAEPEIRSMLARQLPALHHWSGSHSDSETTEE